MLAPQGLRGSKMRLRLSGNGGMSLGLFSAKEELPNHGLRRDRYALPQRSTAPPLQAWCLSYLEGHGDLVSILINP